MFVGEFTLTFLLILSNTYITSKLKDIQGPKVVSRGGIQNSYAASTQILDSILSATLAASNGRQSIRRLHAIPTSPENGSGRYTDAEFSLFKCFVLLDLVKSQTCDQDIRCKYSVLIISRVCVWCFNAEPGLVLPCK